MIEPSWRDVDDDGYWIFIPMNSKDVAKIHIGIKNFTNTKKEDEALSRECEEAIRKALNDLGLRYNTEKYGPIKMSNIRLFCGSDGIAMPKAYFINPSEKLKTISNPLKRS